MNLSEKLAAPSWVVLQLLEQCNLRCAICYEWGDAGTYHSKKKLAMLDVDVVLRTVEECLPTRPVFEFFGGEPLLYPGIWEVIRSIRKGCCDLAFSTNGTLLEENAERLVETAPTQVWVSLDGPSAINDAQRGVDVFRRAIAGIKAIHHEKRSKGRLFPRLGITYVVTALSHPYIEEFFLTSIDLSMLSSVSIELQRYATAEQARAFSMELETEFGIHSAGCADGYVRDPDEFSGMDFQAIERQVQAVRKACDEKGIDFYSQPGTLDVGNIRSFFTANWHALSDRRSRCGVPWLYAEISARGDVTTCHTFYDLAIGNIYEQSLLDIWKSARLKRVQSFLRGGLFSICTACCRYYTGPAVAAKN
jgi:radical SAM protein with 4Fe4S-binding SPASM domain